MASSCRSWWYCSRSASRFAGTGLLRSSPSSASPWSRRRIERRSSSSTANAPTFVRLDDLPPDASFPSGHVAASIAVYGGLALLVTSRLTSGVHRAIVWGIAVAIPLIVGVSRMYRGMHHPLDTLAGVLVGIAALALVVFVARVTGVVARERDHKTGGSPAR